MHVTNHTRQHYVSILLFAPPCLLIYAFFHAFHLLISMNIFFLAMLLLYSYCYYIYAHSFLKFLHIGCFTSCSYIIMFLWGIFSFVLVVGASKFYDFCMFLSTYLSFYMFFIHLLFLHQGYSSIVIACNYFLPLLLFFHCCSFIVATFIYGFFFLASFFHYSFFFCFFYCLFAFTLCVFFCMLTIPPLVALLQSFYSTCFICFCI